MSSNYIDIVFEGHTFSPKKLSQLINFDIEVLAEAGETGVKGRHKGKPMPYGLGLLKVVPLDEESMNEALERVIDELSSKRKELKDSGVIEITLDWENLSDDDVQIIINKEVIKKISSLGANIEFSNQAKSDIKVSANELTQFELALRAYTHPLRQKLIRLIEKEGEKSTQQLSTIINQNPSIVSQHLSILRRAQILSTHRSGKLIYFSLNRRRILEINLAARRFSAKKQERVH